MKPQAFEFAARRLDPDSGYSNPQVAAGQRGVVFCAHGFSSSFSAATLRARLVDRDRHRRGYEGWKAAGLPTREMDVADKPVNGELPGMAGPALSSDEVQTAIEDMRMKGCV